MVQPIQQDFPETLLLIQIILLTVLIELQENSVANERTQISFEIKFSWLIQSKALLTSQNIVWAQTVFF